MRRAVNLAGVDKCLFGTDGPYFHVEKDRFDFSFFLERFKSLGLKAEESKKIGKTNFLEVFGLP
jgi:predicted TIM-barrel fold metal-dependent hydrolase